MVRAPVCEGVGFQQSHATESARYGGLAECFRSALEVVSLNLNFFVGRPFIRRGASALVDRYYAAESPIQRRWRR